MGDRIAKNNPVFESLSAWNAIVNYMGGADPFADEGAPLLLSEFRSSPSEETLLNAATYLGGRAGPSLLFQEHALDLWFCYRAAQLGVSTGIRSKLYYELNKQHDQYASIVAMEPAPADIAERPFRAALAGSLARWIETERVVVVFSHDSDETREFVIPRLIGDAESRGYSTYHLKVLPRRISDAAKETAKKKAAADGDALEEEGYGEELETLVQDADERYFSEARLAEAMNDPFFRAGGDKKALFLDLLDSYDWLRFGEQKWLKPLEALIGTIRARVLAKRKGRLVLLVRGAPFSYNRIWQPFSEFVRRLKFSSDHIVAAGIYPQYMNLHQAAAYLGASYTDVRILANVVPFLFPILFAVRRLIHNERRGPTLAEVVAEVRSMFKTAGGGVWTVSSLGEIGVTEESKDEPAPEAVRPLIGHSYITIDTTVDKVHELAFMREEPPPEWEPSEAGGTHASEKGPALARPARRRREKRIPSLVLYERMPMLHHIPEEISSDDRALIEYLNVFSDRSVGMSKYIRALYFVNVMDHGRYERLKDTPYADDMSAERRTALKRKIVRTMVAADIEAHKTLFQHAPAGVRKALINALSSADEEPKTNIRRIASALRRLIGHFDVIKADDQEFDVEIGRFVRLLQHRLKLIGSDDDGLEGAPSLPSVLPGTGMPPPGSAVLGMRTFFTPPMMPIPMIAVHQCTLL